MITHGRADWNPGTYERFRDLRLRPALDLLAQVPALPAGEVVDLGCGAGAAAPALRKRFPDRRISGLDASPAMLERASGSGAYDALAEARIENWDPAAPVALIFSNAVLHCLPDHDRLMPRLASLLTPGGVLAVQMPGNFEAPSHTLLRATAARLFPDRFQPETDATPVRPARDYVELLALLGAVEGWETEYIQHLAPTATGHPVRAFTESTAMRPFTERLTDDEARAYTHAYDVALKIPYPLRPDGSVLFPFRRIFFVFVRSPFLPLSRPA
jgi:trans-aconitate 2-methyltransferase